MSNELRLKEHPLFEDTKKDRRRVIITVDGRPEEALEGDSLAAALWAGGHVALRHDRPSTTFRGLYCGIGQCFECRVTIDGVADVRSCLVEVRDGMRVSLQVAPHTEKDDGQI